AWTGSAVPVTAGRRSAVRAARVTTNADTHGAEVGGQLGRGDGAGRPRNTRRATAPSNPPGQPPRPRKVAVDQGEGDERVAGAGDHVDHVVLAQIDDGEAHRHGVDNR